MSGSPVSAGMPSRVADAGATAAKAESGPSEHDLEEFRSELQSAIRSAMPDVKSCYDQALAQNPKLGGRLVAKLHLVADGHRGRVTEVDLPESGTSDAFMDACVLSKLANTDFPAPVNPNGMTVTYPFTFSTDPPPSP